MFVWGASVSFTVDVELFKKYPETVGIRMAVSA